MIAGADPRLLTAPRSSAALRRAWFGAAIAKGLHSVFVSATTFTRRVPRAALPFAAAVAMMVSVSPECSVAQDSARAGFATGTCTNRE